MEPLPVIRRVWAEGSASRGIDRADHEAGGVIGRRARGSRYVDVPADTRVPRPLAVARLMD